MRKVIASMFVTLDGVMEAPNQWAFQFGSEEQQKYKFDELFASDALLLGRVTYQGFAAAWPNMPGTGDYGVRMNSLPKYVVSTTLQAVEWNNSRLIKDNIADEVSQLKQQPGQNILLFGSMNPTRPACGNTQSKIAQASCCVRSQMGNPFWPRQPFSSVLSNRL
jgi:dihydrofolate reductase